jgi:post-segregation antitoxin (ccd killing protein)
MRNQGGASGYPGVMPKVNIYLSDDLYVRAKERNLPLSALAQRAVEQALAQSELQSWITRLRSRPRRTVEVNSAALLDQAREEFGA